MEVRRQSSAVPLASLMVVERSFPPRDGGRGPGAWRCCRRATFLVLVGLAGVAHAQQTVPGAPPGGVTQSYTQQPGATPSPAGAAPGEQGPTATTNPPFLIIPSVSAEVTRTSNSTLSATGKPDTIVDLAPSILIRDSGANYTLSGDFTLQGIAYLDHTSHDAILPHGSLDLNADLYNRMLFLDTGVTSTQASSNVFLGQAAGPSTYNLVTTTQYHLSPYLATALTDEIDLYARSDNEFSQSGGSTEGLSLNNGYAGAQLVRLESRPLPFGWAVQLTDLEDRFQSVGDDTLRDGAIRLIGNYAITPETLVGVIAGDETVDVLEDHIVHSIGGVRVIWRPTPLSTFEGTVERRYFGSDWNLKVLARSRLYAFTASWVRTAETYLNALGGGGANLSTLLSQMLAPEYPDAVSRALAVERLQSTTGLPSDLPGAGIAYSENPLLVDVLSATAVYLGRVDTYSLTVFQSRSQDLRLPGQTIVSMVATPESNNLLTGATVNYTRRLSPTTTFNVALTQSNADGLGAQSASSTRQTGVTGQISEHLAPRLSCFFGLRHQIIRFSAGPTINESAAFAGLSQSF